MKRARIAALALVAGVLGTAAMGTACEMAGANTHLGIVTAVDTAGRLTL